MTTLTCVSNEVGGDLIGNALWLGYPIRDLLAEAKPQAGADMVLSTSEDGFTAGRRWRRSPTPTGGAAGHRDERRPAADRARLPGADGRAGAVRLRLGDQVGDRAQGHHLCRRTRATGPRSAGRPGDRSRSLPDRRATREPIDAGPVAVAGVAWASTRASARSRCRSTRAPGSRPSSPTPSAPIPGGSGSYDWPRRPGTHPSPFEPPTRRQAPDRRVAPPAPDGATGIHHPGSGDNGVRDSSAMATEISVRTG